MPFINNLQVVDEWHSNEYSNVDAYIYNTNIYVCVCIVIIVDRGDGIPVTVLVISKDVGNFSISPPLGLSEKDFVQLLYINVIDSLGAITKCTIGDITVREKNTKVAWKMYNRRYNGIIAHDLNYRDVIIRNVA